MAISTPVTTLDGSASLVASEDGSYAIPSGRSATLWYGNAAAGHFKKVVGATGTWTFDNATFGDPASGVAKSGYALLDTEGSGGTLDVSITDFEIGQASYVADEDGTYAITSGHTATAWFGVAGRGLLILNSQSGTITFDSTTFGGDPVPLVAKYGYILEDALGTATNPQDYALSGDFWAVWTSAATSGAATDYKSGTTLSDYVSSQVANQWDVSLVASQYQAAISTMPAMVNTTWGDGTNVTNSNSSSHVTGTTDANGGVLLNVLANTSTATVKFVVISSGSFNLGVSLSDGSALGSFTAHETTISSSKVGSYGASLVTLTVKAASASQELRIYVGKTGSADADIALQALTYSVVAGDVTYELSGQSITSSIGDFTYSVDYQLSGTEATLSLETLSYDVDYALSGVAITSQIDSLTYAVSYDLTGEEITTDTGFLSFDGSVTLSLVGEELTSALGSLLGSIDYAISGQEIALSIGSLTQDISYELLGSEIIFSTGAFSTTVTYAIDGQALTSSQGTISVDGNVTFALTGQSISSAIGTTITTIDSALLGLSISSDIGSMSIEPLTHSQYPLAGLSQGYPLTGIKQTYPLTGIKQTYPLE